MFIKYSIFNHEEKNFADLKTPNYIALRIQRKIMNIERSC
jgi:hypothetical protein